MDIVSYFELNPTAFFISITLLGLIVGSFLNVVIYRLPKMMQKEEFSYCAEILNVSIENKKELPNTLNLAYPASHCPKCGHSLRAWENIPLISYLLQKGRCKHCQTSISVRYPLIELTSSILVIAVAWQFGIHPELLPALLLTWALLVLSLIDVDHQILPDSITQPFLWLGLLCNVFNLYTDLHSSVIGAMVGYLSLWSVYWVFKLLTGKEGMGYGDFKLFAVFGAWLGWQALPIILLLSSITGALVGIILILFKKHEWGAKIPFGPYLAISGWVVLLWGNILNQMYWASF